MPNSLNPLTQPILNYQPFNLSQSYIPLLLMKDILFFSYLIPMKLLNYLNQIRFFRRVRQIERTLISFWPFFTNQ